MPKISNYLFEMFKVKKFILNLLMPKFLEFQQFV